MAGTVRPAGVSIHPLTHLSCRFFLIMEGWIKIHRKVVDCDLYFAEPMTRMSAFFDLCILANHDKSTTYIRGNCVDVRRGQVCRSKDSLAERWKWSRGKVLRYLDDLEKRGMIVQQKTAAIVLISITNYDRYQLDDTIERQQTEQQENNRKTTDGTHTRMSKNVENDNNSIKENPKRKKPEFDVDKFGEWSVVMSEWLEYKSEKRQSYKSQKSVDICFAKLLKLSNGEIAAGRDIVEQSVANNWDGLFELRATSQRVTEAERDRTIRPGKVFDEN